MHKIYKLFFHVSIVIYFVPYGVLGTEDLNFKIAPHDIVHLYVPDASIEKVIFDKKSVYVFIEKNHIFLKPIVDHTFSISLFPTEYNCITISFSPTKDIKNHTIVLEHEPEREEVFSLLKYIKNIRFNKLSEKNIVINDISIKKVAFAVKERYLINIYALKNISSLRKMFDPEKIKQLGENILLRSERLFLNPEEVIRVITVGLT